MSSHQRFFDIQERICLDVKALIDKPKDVFIDEFKQDFSIDIGDNEILLSKRYVPSDNKVKKLVKSGIYFPNKLT